MTFAVDKVAPLGDVLADALVVGGDRELAIIDHGVLGFVVHRSTAQWVIVRSRREGERDPSVFDYVPGTLAELLEAAIASGGAIPATSSVTSSVDAR
jgi:hypothetical protein